MVNTGFAGAVDDVAEAMLAVIVLAEADARATLRIALREIAETLVGERCERFWTQIAIAFLIEYACDVAGIGRQDVAKDWREGHDIDADYDLNDGAP